jgi:hypothetical protein
MRVWQCIFVEAPGPSSPNRTRARPHLPRAVALGLGMTLLAIGYIGRLAKAALEESEAEQSAEQAADK